VLITHDLRVVLDVTDRTMVMYAGRIVEDQPSRALLSGPHHPYTAALLSCYADPTAEVVQLGSIPGKPPDLSEPLAGCSFAPRCSRVEELCHRVEPKLTPLGPGRAAWLRTTSVCRRTPRATGSTNCSTPWDSPPAPSTHRNCPTSFPAASTSES
jgi:oligopeptide/dipeptide ABC transporter ATP-binding protein